MSVAFATDFIVRDLIRVALIGDSRLISSAGSKTTCVVYGVIEECVPMRDYPGRGCRRIAICIQVGEKGPNVIA